MNDNPNEIKKGKILFVEGRDEVMFFNALLKFMGDLQEEIQVISYNGKNNLTAFISMLSKTEQFSEMVTSIAITRDTDGDASAAISSINHTLSHTFKLPRTTHGTYSQNDDIKGGAFLFPGKGAVGELEDLILTSFDGNDVCNLVDEYLDKLKLSTKPKNDDSLFHYPRKESKARIQIYFSSMKESDTRAGISAERKYIDFSHDCFSEIRDFILHL